MAIGKIAGEIDQMIPLHHQVYVVLRQQILEGNYPAERPMPSEQELSRLFKVSRITVRRALDRLQQEGLVTRARGRGTFAEVPLVPPMIQANLRGIFENLLAMGLKTKVQLVDFGYIPAPPDVAAKLGLKSGAIVQRAVRVRHHQNVPFSHLTTYLPEDISRFCAESDLSEKPLLLLLERAGIKISAADQSISAKLADPIVASLLKVEAGSPLIWVKRLVLDQASRPVEYLHALYRPDIYEYQLTMSRVEGVAATLWSPDAATA